MKTCPTSSEISKVAPDLPASADSLEEENFQDGTILVLLRNESLLQQFMTSECDTLVIRVEAADDLATYMGLTSLQSTSFQICRDSKGLVEDWVQYISSSFEPENDFFCQGSAVCSTAHGILHIT